MELYAYYDPPNTQTMLEHVQEALKVFPPNSHLVTFGRKIFPSFQKMLYLTIILHDIGKTPFNTFYSDKIKSREKISFLGHEVISGWITYRLLIGNTQASRNLLNLIGIQSEDFRAAKGGEIITLAVLLHHHPMNLRDRIKTFKDSSSNLYLTGEHISAFCSSLESAIATYLGVQPYIFQKALLEALGEERSGQKIAEDTGNLYDELFKKVWIDGNRKTRKLFLLLLQGLVAADYQSARKRGGEKVSRFSEAMSTFTELYGSAVEGPCDSNG